MLGFHWRLCLFVCLVLAAPLAFGQAGTGSLAIHGAERSTQVQNPATAGSATVTIQGFEQSSGGSEPGGGFCEIDGICPGNNDPVYDSGMVSLTVNGFTVNAFYGSMSTPASIASDLASVFNWSTASPVRANLSGESLTLTARATGQATNFSLSTFSSFDSMDFSFPSFEAAAPPVLAGGQDAQTVTVYDAGSVSIQINGYSQSVNYGQSDSAASIATRLADTINTDCNSLFMASAWNDASSSYVDFRFKQGGPAPGYTLSPSSASTDSHFSGTSFAVSVRPAVATNYYSFTLPANAVIGSTCDRRNALLSLTPDQQVQKIQEIEALIAPQIQQTRQDMETAEAQFGLEGELTDAPFAHNLVNVTGSLATATPVFVDQAGAPLATQVSLTSTNAQASSKALASPTTGLAPLTVTFFNSGSSLDHWDLGDGQTSTSTGSFVHTYQNPGVYSAVPYFRRVTEITRSEPPVVHYTITPGAAITIVVFSALDSDHDGFPESFEGQLADLFTPFYHVSAGEQPGTGFATFLDQVPQTINQVFGPLPPISYFRVTPLGFATMNGQEYGFIEIDYLTLWNRDNGLIANGACHTGLDVLAGLIGFGVGEVLDGLDAHQLDNERSGFLVAAPTVAPGTFSLDPASYGGFSVYTASHEFTFNDHSQYLVVTDTTRPLPAGAHLELRLSRSKHATYFGNPEGLPLTPTPIIFATYSAFDFFLAIGRFNWLDYLIANGIADDVFFGCIVEHFTDQGGSFAQSRTNVGELSAPLNGAGFINDPEPKMGLQNKLKRPLWVLQ